MINLMTCKYLGTIANQGITWCELKRSEFPQCEQCSKFEEQLSYTTTTSTPISYESNIITKNIKDFKCPSRYWTWAESGVPYLPGSVTNEE